VHSASLASKLEPDPMALWRAHVTNALGMTAFWSGAFEAAETAFAETVAAGEPAGYYAAVIYALGYLAAISAQHNEPAEADERLAAARSMAERQALGEHWVIVMVDYAAGERARAHGRVGVARAKVEHGLNIARRGGLRLDTVYGLLALAEVALEGGGTPDEATELRARARRQLAACPDPGFLRDWIRDSGGADTYSVPAAAEGADELSDRELTVLRMLSTRLSLREIGNELYISLNTIKTHTRNIYTKLRVGSREQAVRRAHDLGLLRGSDPRLQ
jgi:LuxR family transcriptional regulator, maltose regulon positive regulatory protein